MTRTPRRTGAPGGKTLIYLGAGLALAGAGAAAAVAGLLAPATSAATGQDSAAHATARARPAGAHRPAGRQAGQRARRAGAARALRRQAGRAWHSSPGQAHRAAHRPPLLRHASWAAVSRYVAAHSRQRPGRGPLPPADRLIPAGTSGPQSQLPITRARYDNAMTIVGQALAKKMGLRAAVIAVATAMAESGLENLSYGGLDSLGLFQQRPSSGWGTAAQILHPSHAASAFLNALHGYQRRDPAWARQPLWQTAQGVQNSGLPYAYAKWEAQAARLVASVTRHLV